MCWPTRPALRVGSKPQSLCARKVSAINSAPRSFLFSDWSKGSYVQNILTGVSEQCPGGTLFTESSYLINDDQPIAPTNADSTTEQNQAGSSLAAAIVITAVIFGTIGFLVSGNVVGDS